MGRINEKVGVVLRRRHSKASEGAGGPRIDFRGLSQDEYQKQRVSDWSESRKLQKIAAMRTALRAQQSFKGAKRLALVRMLNVARQRGKVCVLVLPVSPTYASRLLAPGVLDQFEQSISAIQQEVQGVEWVRFDRMKDLVSDQTFCDLVHMNRDGQALATRFFLKQFQQVSSK